MGTSAGYNMPTGGAWRPLKNDATDFVKAPTDSKVTPKALLNRYIRAMNSAPSAGGSGGGGIVSGGGGGGGGGSSGGGTRSAQRVGRSIGGFFSRVGTAGLDPALREFGLGDLVGKPVLQLAAALLDKLAGPASTIDDHSARAACDDLNKELLREARTPDEVERVLQTALDERGLGGVLMRFFSLYIYRRFCRDFYENWVKRIGAAKANAKMNAIKKYIDTEFKARCINKDVSALNWKGGEGGRLVASILSQTYQVFEVGP